MTQLPTLARVLLARMVHDAERDEVLRDVRDEYAWRAARDGGLRARVWLYRQLLQSVPGLVERSVWRGRTGFESEANRMRGGKAGFETWIQDARFALRNMRARPQYSLLSVLTLALGIGGTTAVFGIARAVLLDPLPYRASGDVAMFWMPGDWSEAEFTHLRSGGWTGFASVAAWRTEGVFLKLGDAPARLVPGVASSAELFSVLGTRPFLGTGFEQNADAVNAEPTAVLSHGLWQELGARRDIIGSTVQLDGVARRVVGVMPAGFWFPDPSVRVWLSTPMRPDNENGNYTLIGRRAPDVALASMAGPLNRITTRLEERFDYLPEWDLTKNPVLTPVRDYLLGPVQPAILATLAGMGVILLMACANVATLMLAQLRGRESELAVRLALGAGRRRITQQLLVESVILGVVAGAVGALAATVGFRTLLAALPLGELAHVARADWTLFAAALLIALTAAMLIALAPVFSLWFGDLRDALSRARSGGIGARGGRLEDALVIGEVALAVLLAATAAVLIRSVDNLYAVDPGIVTRDVGVIDITMSGDVPGEQRTTMVREMVSALAALPGVQSAAATQRLPLHSMGDNWGIRILGLENAPPATTAYRLVTHDYFETMGIELKNGRWFEPADRAGSEMVMVIDEPLARKHFPNEDPIGKMIASGTGLGWMRVIGVVGGVAHNGLVIEDALEQRGLATHEPARYMLYDQINNYNPESASLVIRVARGRDVGTVLQQAVRTIQAAQPLAAVQEATSMDNILAAAMGPTRRVMQLMTLLGVLALTLGAIGVYGVVSHFVNRRRRDWVIRMALGMKPVTVLQQVVGRGALLVAVGCVLGVIASLALTRLFSSLLYDVSAADPLALIAAALTLIVTGCIAALLPGRRASRANPATVLRES